jgi:hypothetical protein
MEVREGVVVVTSLHIWNEALMHISAFLFALKSVIDFHLFTALFNYIFFSFRKSSRVPPTQLSSRWSFITMTKNKFFSTLGRNLGVRKASLFNFRVFANLNRKRAAPVTFCFYGGRGLAAFKIFKITYKY